MEKSTMVSDPFVDAELSARVISHHSGIQEHHVAIILGSGWGKTADFLGATNAVVEAENVPGFSRSTVPGHSGTIRSVTTSSGKNILIIGARTHYYEGRGVRAVVHPVRVAAKCGASVIVLTNGAGGISPSWFPGQPVLISDHLNLTGASPLEASNFLDLTDLYSSRLREIARSLDPSLQEGVYAQFKGPQYETPAEVEMVKRMGAQIVGMSTALEAIAARESGMEILGLSLITNLAAGISPDPLSHREVIEAGNAAEPVISKLLAEIVRSV